MRHYPKELNIKYDEQYFTNGIYDKFAHCESQDIFRRQVEMIEDVSNVENAFKEVSRVLKSNGIFYCSIGLNVAPSHVWVGTIDEWEILINNTSGLQIDKKLTKKIREHPYCMLQNWKTIIARKL